MMTMLDEDHAQDEEYVMIAIGATGADFFKTRGIKLAYELRNLSDQPSFDEVRKIVTLATTMYQNEVFDELYVCYNHHINSLTSQFRVEKMLPISDLDPEEAESYEQEYLFEPSREAILDQLLPQYAESLIYGAIVDAKTAEHAAGMTAMKTATDNAKNIIGDLTISYNRARQGAITQEITEIVAGGIRVRIISRTNGGIRMSSGKIVQVIGPVVDVEFSLDQSLPDINNALIVYKKTRKNKSSIGSRFRTRGWCDPHHRNGIYRRFATRNGSHRYRCLNLCPCRNRYSRPSI